MAQRQLEKSGHRPLSWHENGPGPKSNAIIAGCSDAFSENPDSGSVAHQFRGQPRSGRKILRNADRRQAAFWT
jgi:hypothetical protein